MFEIITAALLIYLIVGHVTLVKRVKHLEKIVRWVEVQSNNNAININAHSSMFNSMQSGIISAPDACTKKDIESANAFYKDRTEYLKSLGVAGEYIY